MKDKLLAAQIQWDIHLACMGSLDFLLVAGIRIPEGKGTLMALKEDTRRLDNGWSADCCCYLLFP